ncbi:CRISPR-associated helicase Cas3' [Thioclava sp. GXIMD4215]|uniref:CRISPR-associated helicase Cas3' n=1 Tax=Thioclava sp. GXIMD4215 TaxID=3131928 RepID=UPI00311AF11F
MRLLRGEEILVSHCVLDWPGKSPDEDGIEHPAVYHMLDVAAVAESLLEPMNLPQAQKSFLALAAGLHDLGKISESFRAMLREGTGQHFGRHWEVTEHWLEESDDLLKPIIPALSARKALRAAIAGHHGRPPVLEDFAKLSRAAGHKAAVDARQVLQEFLQLWPEARYDLPKDQLAAQSWWLPGFITVADWLGSNTAFFPAVPAGPDLASYLTQARHKAQNAVAAAGLLAPPLGQKPIIPADWALRPMQSAAARIVLPDGPVLALIEDETGSGKTEAALILAQRMMQAGKGAGLYFALPTMATANAMFNRAADLIARLYDGAPSLALAHGRAAQSDRFRALLRAPAGSGQPQCSAWLADDRRRALLANVGVGTIDQALLSALPVRHAMLRHYAIAQKILIVDEVHEMGDPYMAESLCRLLELHRRMGGSAILMTATMPIALRDRLCRAFGEAPPDSPAYPALTIAGYGQMVDLCSQSLRGPVQVNRLGDVDQALDLLTKSADDGAACLYVRNAVDDAISACAALRARGVRADLLHARFALSDRLRHEAAALRTYGKGREARPGRVLVATQVVESSLDLDFDVMVADLAPIPALVQRAGRLWRHLDLRPAAQRPVKSPILYVVAPDPADVSDVQWLARVLGSGAFTYPVDLQWRAAKALFTAGQIDAPAGLRALIEAGMAEDDELPPPLQASARERMGKGAAERGLAAMNLIPIDACYRQITGFSDDADFPTRLGQEVRTLVLARDTSSGLQPWAGEGWTIDHRQQSEVSASVSRLARYDLPDQSAPDISALKADWPDWQKSRVFVCPVDEDGRICAGTNGQGLSYDPEVGLIFA